MEMVLVQSAPPRPELRAYVRAYAQRVVDPTEPPLVESVPAQLEQILNLEFGALPGIWHRGRDIAREILVGGSQSSFSGRLTLIPAVQSFAVFFWPSGWSQLFNTPEREITDRFYDAIAVHGSSIRQLWNRMGEEETFFRRCELMDEYLMRMLPTATSFTKITLAAKQVFRLRGCVKMPNLGRQAALGLRHFERLFQKNVGMTPKAFARIARFQAAVDEKLKHPTKTWLEIAHSCDYYDQMHMIHDFKLLGQNTPTRVLAEMGDVRPSALVQTE
jgi:AraC-like DNA-binding protein